MNIVKKNWQFLLATIFVILIFKNWFLQGLIAGGDFIYLYPSMFENRSLFPFAWDWNGNYGLGSFASPLQWVNTVYAVPILFFGKLLGFNWEIVERVGFFFPYLLIGLFSSWYLAKIVFKESTFHILTPLLYTVNTYSLMMADGGQIVGVGLAYSIAPFVLARFIILHNEIADKKNNMRNALFFAFALSLIALFDIRFAYIILFAIFLYFLISARFVFKEVIFLFIIPFGITLLIHAFWLLPILFVKQAPLQSLDAAYNSVNAVNFFSFAKLENSISLLHPYWPENIFGKVGFMKPEFLFLPILAFTSLFAISQKRKNMAHSIIYFSLLGLVGAFLAKGSTEPFGEMYIWLFNHFPGFSMFRDPIKWYTLVAISYSLLIPVVLHTIYFGLKEKSKLERYYVSKIILCGIIIYLLFLVKPALTGALGGTFASHSVSQDYHRLEQKIANDNMFYRTLWFPTGHRYAYASAIHPMVPAKDFFNVYDQTQLIKRFTLAKTQQELREVGIRYIIIPDDTDKEIFLKDRVYSETSYNNAYQLLASTSWLHEVKGFGKIKVFELKETKDHFWSSESKLQVTNVQESPVAFTVKVANAKQGDQLQFAESYDFHWLATLKEGKEIMPTRYNDKIMSFALPQSGNYTISVTYQPQKWILPSVVISITSLVLLIVSLLYIKRK